MTCKWNAGMGVYACKECDGAGVIRSWRTPTINDPYPEEPCECGLGEHLPECDVCGHTIEVAGFDCIVCEFVENLSCEALLPRNEAGLIAALREAMGAARKVELAA